MFARFGNNCLAGGLPPVQKEQEPNVGDRLPQQYEITPLPVSSEEEDEFFQLPRGFIEVPLPSQSVAEWNFLNDYSLDAGLPDGVLHGPLEQYVDTAKVFYGPAEKPTEWKLSDGGFRSAIHGSKVIKRDVPDDQNAEFYERRVYACEMKIEHFPYLSFVGLWNNSPFSKDDVFVKHWGFHHHQVDLDVKLPDFLVPALKKLWVGFKRRELDMQEYSVTVDRARVLCSELAITPEEEYNAVTYGPAIAFVESWDSQQNVARVLTKRYAHTSLRSTFSKNVESWRNSMYITKVAITVVTSIAVVATIWGCLKTHSKLREAIAWYKYKPQETWQDRLVINPSYLFSV